MTATPAVPTETITLPHGGRMPLLGFGTWQLKGDVARDRTREALEAGYRHVDTATMYANEAEVGRALRESGVPREQVFLTTKCAPRQAGKERQTLEQSLEGLGVDQVDLWLVHAPMPDNHHTWGEFVAAQQEGLVRDIGVSNFDAALIDEITDKSGVAPAVNQIEWSPLLYDASVAQAHRERSVVLEGYSGLRGGILDHEVVRGIADGTGRTPAQVVLRWHLQHGFVVIPRTSNPERIGENADLDGFELSEDDMASLDELGGA
jgi:diketogulonate reductase-like aldo/keto reductase